MKNDLLNICPVCGYDKLSEPPYDEHGYPTYEICACCDFEYGVHDSDKRFTFDAYRERWIRDGFLFCDRNEKPENWNKETMIRQMENIGKVTYQERS